jgi:hypothetical protein
MIVDPIDGTRGLMYGKRSAWLLTGVAPAPRLWRERRSAQQNKECAAEPHWGSRVLPPEGGSESLGAEGSGADGALPTMREIAVAMQTELPTARAYLSDMLWAVVGEGAHAETHDLLSGAVSPATLQPSRAAGLEHGFAAITKFFPGGKELAARLEEQLFLELMGPPSDGNPQVFDDEYICSGGQLYELMAGHDRFLADLRPVFHAALRKAVRDDPSSPLRPYAATPLLCCHPYDLCTELIAREAGVAVTDERGAHLDAPLDIRADVSWIGYANASIRRKVEPLLLRLLAQL